MSDVIQHNDNHQYQHEDYYKTIDDTKSSSLIEQIHEQLMHMRQDDVELTEKLTSIYDGLCHLRQTLTNPQLNSNTDIATAAAEMDSLTTSPYPSKQRSDSEPNILADRQLLMEKQCRGISYIRRK